MSQLDQAAMSLGFAFTALGLAAQWFRSWQLHRRLHELENERLASMGLRPADMSAEEIDNVRRRFGLRPFNGG